MNFKYHLTDSFLNAVTEFYRLHGALYALGAYLPWKDELMQVAGDKAALAAVSLDADTEVESIINNSVNIIPSKEIETDFKNYRKTKDTLEHYFGSINTLNIETFHQIHQSVLGEKYEAGKTQLRKKMRTIPKAIYDNGTYKRVDIIVRTKPSEIEARLEDANNWIKYNYRILNPVIKAATIYYMLAKIHPYEDGNGRIAKIIIHGILYQNNIDKDNIIVIEEYYLKNRTKYYDTLARAIETADLTEWLEFFANALLYGAIESCKILYKLSGGSIDVQNSKFISLTINQRDLINVLHKVGSASGADLGRELKLSRQYINNLLRDLIKLNIVQKQGVGRGSIYSLKVSA